MLLFGFEENVLENTEIVLDFLHVNILLPVVVLLLLFPLLTDGRTLTGVGSASSIDLKYVLLWKCLLSTFQQTESLLHVEPLDEVSHPLTDLQTGGVLPTLLALLGLLVPQVFVS